MLASGTALIGACTLARRADTPSVHEAHPATLQLAIAQVRTGQQARFEVCELDACPRPTAKTAPSRAETPAAAKLAETPDTAALPLASPVESPAPVASQAPRPANEVAAAIAVPSRTAVVTFAFAKAILSEAAQKTLAAVVADMGRARVVEIRGRTDELGSVAFNDALARERALAVRDFLRTHELPESTTLRLSFKGACCYVADNDSPTGRAANRRVEIEWQPELRLAQGSVHERN